MGKRQKSVRNRHGLQTVTLCISTSLVLILLGLVVLFVLAGKNLSSYVKENLVITIMLEDNMTKPETQKIYSSLNNKTYIKTVNYISKEQALGEATKEMGADPSEFTDGVNPFLSSIELTLKSDYANNDSLKWISTELRSYPKVGEINYQKEFIDKVNQNIAKVGIVLLVLAVLLSFVSFSLINNTINLSIYARRFSIHTMKLVGASWSFIRKPFVRKSVLLGLLAAFIAVIVLGGAIFALYINEPGVTTIITWQVMLITAAAVFVFGIVITAICANISVNKFLRMKASELYKI